MKTEEKKEALKSVEELAVELKTPDWALAATKAARRWAAGKQLTESEFLQAVDSTLNLKLNAS